MKALYSAAWTVAVGVAAQIAAPGTACARDTLVLNVGMRSVTLAPAGAGVVSPQLDPSPAVDALKTDPVSSSAAAAAAVVPLIETEAAPGESVQLEIEDPRFDFPDDAACGDSCPPKPLNLQLLPREIMRNLDRYPVLDAVVTPVTTGVTVEPLEGLPPVTIAVKPAKIGRGSAVIAVTRF
jgi:hypothetical protein